MLTVPLIQVFGTEFPQSFFLTGIVEPEVWETRPGCEIRVTRYYLF